VGEFIHIGSTGTQCIGAYLAKPTGRPKGGVVVVQEIFGVNAHIRSVVDDYAGEGYLAIAPAVFDHLETGVELGYDQAGMKKGIALVGELGFERPLEDVASAAEAIKSAGKIGVVGFCWGGTIAYLAAIKLGLPAVSYYGGRNTQLVGMQAKAPLLFHYGLKDAHIGAADREKVRVANPDAEFYEYDADHGFNCDVRASFDAAAARLARERRLLDDARFGWLVLVPRRPALVEIFDLNAEARMQLLGELDLAAAALRAEVPCDKFNVGALGNVVPQLHVHLVARRIGDAAWPGPVWGHGTRAPYAPSAGKALCAALRQRLGAAAE
jgi:carboxymethylenebutenolidase